MDMFKPLLCKHVKVKDSCVCVIFRCWVQVVLCFLVNSGNHTVIYSVVVCVNAEKFRQDLLKIAMTTLCSKILSQDKEHFAEMAVDAVFRLKVPYLPLLNSLSIVLHPSLSL